MDERDLRMFLHEREVAAPEPQEVRRDVLAAARPPVPRRWPAVLVAALVLAVGGSLLLIRSAGRTDSTPATSAPGLVGVQWTLVPAGWVAFGGPPFVPDLLVFGADGLVVADQSETCTTWRTTWSGTSPVRFGTAWEPFRHSCPADPTSATTTSGSPASPSPGIVLIAELSGSQLVLHSGAVTLTYRNAGSAGQWNSYLQTGAPAPPPGVTGTLWSLASIRRAGKPVGNLAAGDTLVLYPDGTVGGGGRCYWLGGTWAAASDGVDVRWERLEHSCPAFLPMTTSVDQLEVESGQVALARSSADRHTFVLTVGDTTLTYTNAGAAPAERDSVTATVVQPTPTS